MLIALPCLFLPTRLSAGDVGFTLDQTAGYGGLAGGDTMKQDDAYDYSGALNAWFSGLTGDNGGFFVSSSFRVEREDETMTYIPEVLRSEFFWRSEGGELRLGRMQYADPLGFIANGLFDGAYISLDTGGGSVSMGTWYTGLLYKERANITMTQTELQSYNTPLDYNNLSETAYFAPRRVVSALGWEHPGLAGHTGIQLAFLNQFDLTSEDKLNTSYFTGKLSVPAGNFVFDLGGCLEAVEFADKNKIALAGELGISWISTEARLSLSGRFSGGVPENGDSMMTAFLPLSTVYQGDILKAKLSGLSVVSLDYLTRLHRTFSAGLTASCFMRNDLGTYNGYPVTVNAGDGYILGTELFGRLFWAPVSDMRINLGGGGFLPVMGNTDRNAAILWRVEMNLVFVVY